MTPSRAVSIRDHVDAFLRQMAATRGASEHTLRAYGGDLNELCAFLEERAIADPREVTPRTVRGFLAELDGRELASATMQRKLSSVRSFFRHLLREGRIDTHPVAALRSRKGERKLPGTLSGEEIDALLAAPDLSTSAGRRDRAIFELMYSAGTRAAETVGLDRQDLDLKRGVARVRGKGRKERLARARRRA